MGLGIKWMGVSDDRRNFSMDSYTLSKYNYAVLKI